MCMLHHDEKCGREKGGQATSVVKGQGIQKKEQKGNSLVVSLFLSHWGKIHCGSIRGDLGGCDFISPFHGPCLLVPLLCMVPFLEWKDGLPFSFISLRWSREAGRTTGQDWQERGGQLKPVSVWQEQWPSDVNCVVSVADGCSIIGSAPAST